jgi:hypothetical protein
VALAIVKLLSLAARPTDAILGEIPGHAIYTVRSGVQAYLETSRNRAQ